METYLHEREVRAEQGGCISVISSHVKNVLRKFTAFIRPSSATSRPSITPEAVMDLWFLGLIFVLAVLPWAGSCCANGCWCGHDDAVLGRPDDHAGVIRLPHLRHAQSGEVLT